MGLGDDLLFLVLRLIGLTVLSSYSPKVPSYDVTAITVDNSDWTFTSFA